MSSSLVASTWRQSTLARSSSLRECSTIGIGLTLVGLAQADDPPERVVVNAAPGVDAHENSAADAAIGDDPTFPVVLPPIIELDRGPSNSAMATSNGKPRSRALRSLLGGSQLKRMADS